MSAPYGDSSKQINTSRESSFYGKGFVPEQDLVMWPCRIQTNLCEDCPINPTFLLRLATWSNGIEWQIGEHLSLQVSYLELMLAYIYDTHCHPPFPAKKYPNNPKSRAVTWQLRDQFPTSDYQRYDLGSLLSGFKGTVIWAERYLEIKIFPGNHKPDLACLSRYGFRALKVPGFRARPKLPKQDLVDAYCNKHLPNKSKIESPIPYSAPSWLLSN